MLKSHVKFHSSNGKRMILVADDEQINRAILGNLLEEEYEIIYAEDGIETMQMIRDNKDELSLVLLDILMPGMTGLDVLRAVKEDADLQSIPVIVITADHEAEIESLSLGAIDFIPKPYPQAGVILARIRRTIELSEDRDIISSTERDPLTGLYNREYFYRYAEQFDQHHKGMQMDAIVIDVNHFHMINERFGTTYGDEVLRRIGERVREMVLDTGGIVCRRAADTFMVYCPHGKDYQAILDNASVGLSGDNSVNNRVRLRMGVYENADKTLDIERRFDRAKMAADTVRNSFVRTIGIYDSSLHEKEIYNEQLLEDFNTAISERQFQVYYQPKFDIRHEIPVLSSAEALVRWIHPKLGMISPGIFIPLFEENGLIQRLDHYVWASAAEQIGDWKKRLGFAVPVSVNVSRIDMYDPRMIDTLTDILEKNDLIPYELILEITESAYTQDSEQIIETVNKLRDIGFRIEMDDFGTGYSSLNMISTLPIDALKLDMKFIRTAFTEGKGTRMLEVIIDIADYLGVPVIAEGVETENQLIALRNMGCDIVQGYYFSKPVPAEEYEKFVTERRDRGSDEYKSAPKQDGHTDRSFNRIVHALSAGFSNIYYIDAGNGHFVEFTSRGSYDDLQIEKSGSDFFSYIQTLITKSVHPEDQVRVSMSLHKKTLLGSVSDNHPFSLNYRKIVGDKVVMWNLKAVTASTHDDHHIVVGLSSFEGHITDDEKLRTDSLSGVTYSAIAKALSQDYFSIYYVDTDNDYFIEYTADEEFSEFGFEKSGMDFFGISRRNIRRAIHPDDQEQFLDIFTKENIIAQLGHSMTFTHTYRLMLEDGPTYVNMKITRMADPEDKHIVVGVSNVDEQVRREQEHRKAVMMANRDALTGVKSKHAYVESEARCRADIAAGEAGEFAVAVCDVNGLKEINDSKGHQAGDEYIKAACKVICDVFDHSPVYRIGGDEFVVILRGSDYLNREALVRTMHENNNRENAVIIATGISDYIPGTDTCLADVFGRADADMYQNKKKLKTYAGA